MQMCYGVYFFGSPRPSKQSYEISHLQCKQAGPFFPSLFIFSLVTVHKNLFVFGSAFKGASKNRYLVSFKKAALWSASFKCDKALMDFKKREMMEKKVTFYIFSCHAKVNVHKKPEETRVRFNGILVCVVCRYTYSRSNENDKKIKKFKKETHFGSLFFC